MRIGARVDRPSRTTRAGNGIAALLDEVEQEKLRLQRPGITLADDIWFRGHSDPVYVLLPTLLRMARELGISGDEVRTFESDLFFEFQAKGLPLMGQGLSDWDQLFVMRHHKLPTRLLDWSESFAVGLFFAMDGVGEGKATTREPVVKLLNPYALNACLPRSKRLKPDDVDLFAPKFLGWEPYEDAEDGVSPKGEYWDYSELLVEVNGIDWETPVALYPIRNSPRVRAQHGWFTIHGTNADPIEKIAPDAVGQVTIRREYWPQVQAYLESTGIDRFQIYADLDSLADSICQKARRLWARRRAMSGPGV